MQENINEESLVEIAKRYQTLDGGASQSVADLWCTYAAIRTLTWLDDGPNDPKSCARFLRGCQNRDGAFGWSKGMRSDVWATYYCTQALTDLRLSIPHRDVLHGWLDTLLVEGGYGMTPGQPPDLWATYYATRIYQEILNKTPSEPEQTLNWIKNKQLADGGIGWGPVSEMGDVRAAYYASHAWQQIRMPGFKKDPFDVKRLIQWLQGCQLKEGGFRFHRDQDAPCLWATFRAVRALDVWGAKPVSVESCIRWIMSRKLKGSGFSRWDGYNTADVWACFSAVGALKTLGVALPEKDREEVVSFLRSCQISHTGFTYREPDWAGDALSSAALVLAVPHQTDLGKLLVQWLHHAHMPYEGGVMYMPARGAEVRCTLWALAAIRHGKYLSLNKGRLKQWFTHLQNSDGGFGYWEGRGSDVTATVSAMESLCYLGEGSLESVRIDQVGYFLDTCSTADGIHFSPQGEVNLASTCMGIRGFAMLGRKELAHRYAGFIPKYQSRLGGYSSQIGGLPDLNSTYQAVLTLDSLGMPWNPNMILRFIKRIQKPKGYAWSPLSREESGPLTMALADSLRRASEDKLEGRSYVLPKLNL
ncbi:prenyltransferase/squalene oxidase repeat-containing protein [Desmospora profundinema]|uniref:Prenyltransferase beta subunit n=1 Tax=Desmospora profundinema TaxID=1571184 RepID=A0ABU1IQ99_9BACL|nr:prenyltransferase/squalene oxidase repeat-containing protein [Desmospora profundinema]MDR6226593.1 prenyltransferase beta subunit [Desmospora profundinema]